MSSSPSSAFPTDLWLQRSRLDGMILAGFTYGIFFLLSLQALKATYRGSQSQKLRKWQIHLMYVYIIVTFVLATVGFACNARYTEDIWINFRYTTDRSPEDLIINEFDYWWNIMAIDSNFVMIWIMDLLLLYRCFVIWNYQIWVIGIMSAVYLGIIGLSISVMHFAQQRAVFFNIKVQIAFLVMSCTFNLLFTVLVSTKLLSMRRQIIQVLGKEHAKTYTSITATLVESASLYFVFDVIFLFAFGFGSHVQNLILLEYSSIQGIAELLIIVRVARGEDYDTHVATKTLTRMDFDRPRDETGGGTRSMFTTTYRHGAATTDGGDGHLVIELPQHVSGTTGSEGRGTHTQSHCGSEEPKEV
ncbi:hypothetical protein AAF712_013117 [Marasmius tenuissimus]|uniref:Uncharacterized protein n=1 Tax=Marasmius tenuissimus TaxID=585030 RepID=A0ABR2ZFI4_9AGAR